MAEYRGIDCVETEYPQVKSLLDQSLPVPPKAWPFIEQNVAMSDWRGLFEGKEPIAAGNSFDMAHWYGGRSIKAAGITLVGVAAHHRGQGVAKSFMTEWLRDLHSQGYPIASLFASTQSLYRSVGFEHSGDYVRYEMPVKAMRSGCHECEIHQIENPVPELFESLVERRGRRNNGNIQRCQGLWNRVFTDIEHKTYCYLLGPKSAPEGFICYTLIPLNPGYHMYVRDWYAETPRAIQRLWSLVADHRSVTRKVTWPGAPSDEMLIEPAELPIDIIHYERWMLRILDLERALADRGYGSLADAELTLSVTDPIFAHNDGHFKVQLRPGEGVATRVSKVENTDAHASIDIRWLTPLFTGLMSASRLRASGKLEGTNAAIAMLDRSFSDGMPWSAEHF